MKKNKRIYIWLPLLLAVAIVIGIVIGFAFPKNGRHYHIFSKGSGKLNTILNYISNTYVDSVSIHDLSEKAISAVVSNLDPHSIYMSPESMALTGSELDGHFGGIGVEFMIMHDTIVVVNVTKGGPSQAIGIKPGDRVVYANDSLFVGKTLTNERVFEHLRGKKGTKINLKIKRHGINHLLNFTVTRADVPVKSVDAAYKLDKDIGYVKVSRFGSNTYNEFITAIARLKNMHCKSFIIDLQGNSGGYLGATILMVNEFLSKNQLIVYTKGRVSPRDNVFADGTGSCKSDPVAVLIDEGTASASEIFSGAIQDNDRGIIVGRRSFGKGLVQTQHVFKDGSALRLTIARYYTPSGRCIQKKYTRGHLNEYEMDLINRYKHGEFENKDSIKLNKLPQFHTKDGRTVYADGGIMSDVFIPRDTTGVNSYYINILNKGALKEYAFNYTENYRDKLMKFNDWHKAYAYLQKQPLVNNLVNYALKEKKIIRRPYLINQCKFLLKNQLEALIIRNIYGDDAFYQIYQKDDRTINNAIHLIEQGYAMPASIAHQTYNKYRIMQ